MKIEYVKDLIDRAVSWELQIPEFQRKYVWDKEQIKLLIDSLYRNYTINSILIWEWWDELARRSVWESIHNIIIPENIQNKTITYLLDWQQRTTSLTAIFSNKPIYKKDKKNPIKYNLFLDIENFDENSEEWIFDRLFFDDEKIEDTSKNNIKSENLFFNNEEQKIWKEYFKLKDFSFKDLYKKFWLKYIPLKALYIDDIEKYFIEFLKNEDIKEFFSIIWVLKKKILDRKVHVIEQEGRLEQVLDIFERINTKNTKLNIFDVMVAKTYRKVWNKYFNLNDFMKLIKYKKSLSKNNYFEEVDNLIDEDIYKFNDDKELLFIVMLFLQKKKIVKEKEILKISTNQLIDSYKLVNKLFKQLINELDNFKIQPWNYNKFKPIIKFFALYISSNSDLTYEKRQFLSKWFWNTILYNRYSWAQNERIQKDFEILTIENYYNELYKTRAKVFDENKILDAYYDKQSNKWFTALELLLINNWVKDFYSWEEVNKWTENKGKMELHHIFPVNSEIWKQIKKRWDNIINNIANLTPLTNETNNKFINNKNPSIYIKNFRKEIWNKKFNTYLKTHFISSEMVSMLENNNFDWFIKARTKLILEKIYELTELD